MGKYQSALKFAVSIATLFIAVLKFILDIMKK